MKTKLAIITILVIFIMSCGLFQADQTSTAEPGVELPVETLELDSPTSIPEGGTNLLWEKPVFNLSFGITEQIVFIGSGGTIEAVELNSGTVLWSVPYQGQIIGADSEHVYVVPAPQRVEALSASNGDVVWHALLDAQIEPLGLTVVAKNSIIVPTNSGYQFRIDKQNGNILEVFERSKKQFGDVLVMSSYAGGENAYIAWSTELERPILDLSDKGEPVNMQVCNDLVFYLYSIDNNNGRIAAVNKKGEPLWQTDLQEPYSSLLYCAIGEPPLTGVVGLQSYSAFRPIFGALVIDNLSENVYFLGSGLTAVNKQSGEIRWVGYEIPEPFHIDSPNYKNSYRWLGEVNGKVVYSHTGFGLTQVYDAKDNQLVWENSGLVLDSLVGATGKTIIGITNIGLNETIVGLDADNGNQIWSQQGKNPLLIGDRLIFTSDSSITFVDPHSGNILQQITLSKTPIVYYPVGDYLVAVSSSTVAVIKL